MPFDNQDKAALKRWRQPGDVGVSPKRLLYNAVAYRMSTRNLVDADHVRLQQVNISYNLPRTITSRLRLGSLKIYAQGSNLALWSTKKQATDIGNVNILGQLYIQYPTPKSFSIGINVGF